MAKLDDAGAGGVMSIDSRAVQTADDMFDTAFGWHDDWPEETGFITASAACLQRQAIRDAYGADSTGLLTCALDFNHEGPHWDASDEIEWCQRTAEEVELPPRTCTCEPGQLDLTGHHHEACPALDDR
jgi:hypothetical protein